MASEGDILELSNGSRFYRADLHIHSYDASHDVSDKAMTPPAIVKTAIEQNLDVIAIADHNEISNVETAISAASKTPLYVVPGVELSTPQGHLLCYLPTFDALQSFFGRLDFADRGIPTSRCQNAILDCLHLLDELKGFGLLAHVDAPSGFETENPGNSPHKHDVLCNGALRWPRFVGQLGGLIKVYTSCRSCRQNPFASISLPLLLRLWGCGQGA